MLIITGGAFGADVAGRIARRRPVVVREVTDDAAATLDMVAEHELVLMASWRPYIELARSIDSRCHEAGRRWCLAEMSGTTLTCGPLIAPGSGTGCYHCLLARVDAHQRSGDRTLVLRQAYAANPRLGPDGHSAPMAAIAAAALLEEAESTPSGRFRKIDVLTGTVLETELIPLHDCPRCRPVGDGYIPSARFIDTMVPQLARILA